MGTDHRGQLNVQLKQWTQRRPAEPPKSPVWGAPALSGKGLLCFWGEGTRTRTADSGFSPEAASSSGKRSKQRSNGKCGRKQALRLKSTASSRFTSLSIHLRNTELSFTSFIARLQQATASTDLYEVGSTCSSGNRATQRPKADLAFRGTGASKGTQKSSSFSNKNSLEHFVRTLPDYNFGMNTPF